MQLRITFLGAHGLAHVYSGMKARDRMEKCCLSYDDMWFTLSILPYDQMWLSINKVTDKQVVFVLSYVTVIIIALQVKW